MWKVFKCVLVLLVPGGAIIMSSMTKCKAARVSAFSFHPHPPAVDGMKKAQRGIINWTKLKKIIGQLDSIRPHFTSFCAAIMEAANLEKGQEMYSVCTCACVCPSLPVNRALIALALQLVDFHSNENFGINKDSIFKVLQCVIICEFQLKNSY